MAAGNAGVDTKEARDEALEPCPEAARITFTPGAAFLVVSECPIVSISKETFSRQGPLGRSGWAGALPSSARLEASGKACPGSLPVQNSSNMCNCRV